VDDFRCLQNSRFLLSAIAIIHPLVCAYQDSLCANLHWMFGMVLVLWIWYMYVSILHDRVLSCCAGVKQRCRQRLHSEASGIDGPKPWPESCLAVLQEVNAHHPNREGSYMFDNWWKDKILTCIFHPCARLDLENIVSLLEVLSWYYSIVASKPSVLPASWTKPDRAWPGTEYTGLAFPLHRRLSKVTSNWFFP
jgi:hypothetical protein